MAEYGWPSKAEEYSFCYPALIFAMLGNTAEKQIRSFSVSPPLSPLAPYVDFVRLQFFCCDDLTCNVV